MKEIATWGDYHLFVNNTLDSDGELEITIECDFSSPSNVWLTRDQIHDLIHHLQSVIATSPGNENKTI